MTGRLGQGARTRPSGTSLSRDQVLEAALEVLEAEGVEGLTVRGLASKLGVAATSIYWHVGDKEALLDGVAERVIARLSEVPVRGRDPQERIVSAARSLRTTLLRHAEMVALVHRQGRTAALFQPVRRVLLKELLALGADEDDAVLSVQAILNLVIGSVLLDRQVERQPAQHQNPEELWQPADALGSPELFSHLSHSVDEEKLFDFMLSSLVEFVSPA